MCASEIMKTFIHGASNCWQHVHKLCCSVHLNSVKCRGVKIDPHKSQIVLPLKVLNNFITRMTSIVSILPLSTEGYDVIFLKLLYSPCMGKIDSNSFFSSDLAKLVTMRPEQGFRQLKVSTMTWLTQSSSSGELQRAS